MTTDDTKT